MSVRCQCPDLGCTCGGRCLDTDTREVAKRVSSTTMAFKNKLVCRRCCDHLLTHDGWQCQPKQGACPRCGVLATSIGSSSVCFFCGSVVLYLPGEEKESA